MHLDPRTLYDENGLLRPIHQLPAEVAACISSIQCDESWIGEGTERKLVGRITKVKFWNKVTAIAKAMEHFDLLAAAGLTITIRSADQAAKMAETEKALEALLKEKEQRWHGSGVVPITPRGRMDEETGHRSGPSQ
jgi:hypothetical protein